MYPFVSTPALWLVCCLTAFTFPVHYFLVVCLFLSGCVDISLENTSMLFLLKSYAMIHVMSHTCVFLDRVCFPVTSTVCLWTSCFLFCPVCTDRLFSPRSLFPERCLCTFAPLIHSLHVHPVRLSESDNLCIMKYFLLPCFPGSRPFSLIPDYGLS